MTDETCKHGVGDCHDCKCTCEPVGSPELSCMCVGYDRRDCASAEPCSLEDYGRSVSRAWRIADRTAGTIGELVTSIEERSHDHATHALRAENAGNTVSQSWHEGYAAALWDAAQHLRSIQWEAPIRGTDWHLSRINAQGRQTSAEERARFHQGGVQ